MTPEAYRSKPVATLPYMAWLEEDGGEPGPWETDTKRDEDPREQPTDAKAYSAGENVDVWLFGVWRQAVVVSIGRTAIKARYVVTSTQAVRVGRFELGKVRR